MKAAWICALCLGLILFASVSSGADYTFKDKSFKEKNLRALKPYGPGFNEEQRALWAEFIRMAALYEDFDITARMFALKDKTDGVESTQYSLDLFDLYKKNPIFFVKALDRYYRGNFKAFLPVWINETQDITTEEIKQVAKGVSKNKLMDTFLKSVDSLSN
jgi:hypothetical protein